MVYKLLLVSIVSVIASSLMLARFSNKIVLLKSKIIYIVINTAFIIWSSSFIYLVLFEKLTPSEALYWVIVAAFSSEPLLEPPSSIIAKSVLLTDSVTSFFILAVVISFIVEFVVRKAIETYEKEIRGLTKMIERENHIVIIGWTKATRYAYNELLRLGYKSSDIVVVEDPDVVYGIKREIEEKPSEIIGGNPLDDSTLIRAGVHKAKSIIISFEDDPKASLALLHVKQVIKRYRKEERNISIVVEIMHDENEKLIRSISTDSEVNIIPVLSRSLLGRLFASIIMEPGVVAFICDASSATYGIVDFDEIAARELIENSHVAYYDIQRKLLQGKNPYDRKIILAIIREKKDEHKIVYPSKDTYIEPDDKLIVLRYIINDRVNNSEKINELVDYMDKDNPGFILEKYSWFASEKINGETIFDNLWKIEKNKGHISIIGWSEATESFIEEVEGVHERIAEFVDGKLSPGYTINKSMVLLSQVRDVNDINLYDTIVVYGDTNKPENLKRAGILSADAIIISVETDNDVTHSLLHIKNMLNSRKITNRPVIIAETQFDETAELLLDNRLADVIIPGRSLAGRLLAYAAKDPLIFNFLVDLISSAEGQLDIREIEYNEILNRIGREDLTFEEIFQHLFSEYNTKMIPVAIITRRNNRYIMVYLPSLNYRMKKGDKIIAIAYYKEKKPLFG